MFSKHLLRPAVPAMLLVSLVSSVGLAKLPDAGFLKDIAGGDGSISPKQKEQLAQYVPALVQVMATSSDPKEIVDARNALVQSFRISENVAYQETEIDLAWSAAQKALPNLKGDLKSVREINLAVAISSMSRTAVRPALDYMIVHENPAVRYCGWAGYRSIRDQLLSFKEFADKMRSALETRSAAEPSGPVLGMIFETCLLPPTRSAGVPEATYQAFQDAAFKIIAGCWEKRCRQLLGGDAQLAEAMIKGLAAAENFSAVFEGNAERKAALLQMAADVLVASSLAYEEAFAAQRSAQQSGGDSTAFAIAREANAQLLRECERTLTSLSGQQRNLLAQALKGAAAGKVGMAAVDWIAALAPMGVKDPSGKFAAPAATPAKVSTN